MNWVKAHKVWSAVIIVAVLAIISSSSSGGTKKTAPPAPKQQTASKTTTAPQSTVPNYSLVGTSGSVHVYLISPSDATDAKLTALGKKLYSQFSSDNITRISIFTDRDQAKIMADNPLAPADLQGDAATAYNKAYVAQLNVNQNTGLKEYFIYPQGLDGPSKQITI